MGVRLIRPVSSAWLGRHLGAELSGNPESIIECVSPYSDNLTRSLSFFVKEQDQTPSNRGVVLVLEGADVAAECKLIVKNPRLAFAQALDLLSEDPGFDFDQSAPAISSDALIASTAVLGAGVKIGKRTIIGHNVVITDRVEIGEDCIIKANSVIGDAGFGFERNQSGTPMRLPHIGSVRIGNRVEIGSLNTICRGTIENTVIEDDVKLDDHVHVAHNCHISKKSLITAGSVLCGGVFIGAETWLGPNCTIKQKVIIGERCFIGIASNVTKNVEAGKSVAGNPARTLRT